MSTANSIEKKPKVSFSLCQKKIFAATGYTYMRLGILHGQNRDILYLHSKINGDVLGSIEAARPGEFLPFAYFNPPIPGGEQFNFEFEWKAGKNYTRKLYTKKDEPGLFLNYSDSIKEFVIEIGLAMSEVDINLLYANHKNAAKKVKEGRL